MNAALLFAACIGVDINSSVVSLKNDEGGSSGVIINVMRNGRNNNLYSILTCAHGKKADTKIDVRFAGGAAVNEGAVVAFDEAMDLALVEVVAAHRYSPIKLLDDANDVPKPDTIVKLIGYGSDNRKVIYSERQTKVIGMAEFTEWKHARLRCEGTGRPGDSGGALLVNGKLCGINVAAYGPREKHRDSFAVTHKEIHKFLEEAGHHP